MSCTAFHDLLAHGHPPSDVDLASIPVVPRPFRDRSKIFSEGAKAGTKVARPVRRHCLGPSGQRDGRPVRRVRLEGPKGEEFMSSCCSKVWYNKGTKLLNLNVLAKSNYNINIYIYIYLFILYI